MTRLTPRRPAPLRYFHPRNRGTPQPPSDIPPHSIYPFAVRQIADIPHPDAKITVFAWNGKLLVKLERGPFEQTYKVAELDLPPGPSEELARRLVDTAFVAEAVARFSQMAASWADALERLEG